MRTWLKNRRVQIGYNQEEIANLSGISRSYYTLIELGRKTPTVKVAKSIATHLKFNWTLFYEDEE